MSEAMATCQKVRDCPPMHGVRRPGVCAVVLGADPFGVAQGFGIGLSPSASLGVTPDNRLNFDKLRADPAGLQSFERGGLLTQVSSQWPCRARLTKVL